MFYKTNPPKNGNYDSKYNLIKMKRGPKAPRRVRRAPKPSAGARRRGAEHPELLVLNYICEEFCASKSRQKDIVTQIYRQADKTDTQTHRQTDKHFHKQKVKQTHTPLNAYHDTCWNKHFHYGSCGSNSPKVLKVWHIIGNLVKGSRYNQVQNIERISGVRDKRRFVLTQFKKNT